METNCIRRRLAGIALALFAAAAPAAASPSAVATIQAQANSATAVVSFQIVIPEVVAFGADVQRQPATAPTLTRTVSIESGVQLVTIARP